MHASLQFRFFSVCFHSAWNYPRNALIDLKILMCDRSAFLCSSCETAVASLSQLEAPKNTTTISELPGELRCYFNCYPETTEPIKSTKRRADAVCHSVTDTKLAIAVSKFSRHNRLPMVLYIMYFHRRHERLKTIFFTTNILFFVASVAKERRIAVR